MIQITHKTTPEQLRIAEGEIGDMITECYAECGLDRTCRMIYETNIMPLNAELVQILSHPLSEIKQNKTWVFKLLNARNYMTIFETVIANRLKSNISIVTERRFKTEDDISICISKDISSFSFWIIYHGSPEEARRMKRKDVEAVNRADREVGCVLPLSLMLRASILFKFMCEKVLHPACGELIRREKEQRRLSRPAHISVQPCRDTAQSDTAQSDTAQSPIISDERFNTMQSAFALLNHNP